MSRAEGSEGLLGAFTSGLRVAYSIMAVVVLAGVVASAFKGQQFQPEPETPEVLAAPTSDKASVRQAAD